ncbi:hypothetical protein RXV91_02810 [Lactiplantibacillus sp. DA1]|nr:hypothetical protein [Lactiplantibacillus sp. DA1]MDV0429813.1 hypothetical protein [Lactiplantibacillus sp. DA1]
MKQQKKLARLTIVNQLLEQLNASVPVERVDIRKLISKAYATINQPDSTTKRYQQVPDAINELNSQFQAIAVAKKYHFSSEQDKLISELTTFTNKMFTRGWYGLIYMSGIGN